MLSLLEIAERAQKGHKLEEKQWQLGLFSKMTALTREFQIPSAPEGMFFNRDDSLPERAFQAALRFLSDTGVYCLTTNRIIQFSEDEVRQAIHQAPRQIIVGEGRDQRMLCQRGIETRERLNFTPGHHAPFTEDMARLVIKNLAQIPAADFVQGFNFTSVDGREIAGMPLEAYAARRQAAWLRDGVHKAGRPGMSVVCYPLTTRSSVLIAPMDPEYGLRRTDGIFLAVLPDLEVEVDLLTAAIVYEDYGCYKINGSGGPLVGGFSGGMPGALIEGILIPLVAMLVYRVYVTYTGIRSIGFTTSKGIHVDPALHWAHSVICQALNRFTGSICFTGGGGAAGTGTEERLLEAAMNAFKAPISGTNLCQPRQNRAQMNAAQTPLEAELMWEVAEAGQTAGFDRERGEVVMRHLAGRLEGRPVPPGKDIRQCYDLVHHQPSPEYGRLYQGVKEELAGLGLDFS